MGSAKPSKQNENLSNPRTTSPPPPPNPGPNTFSNQAPQRSSNLFSSRQDGCFLNQNNSNAYLSSQQQQGNNLFSNRLVNAPIIPLRNSMFKQSFNSTTPNYEDHPFDEKIKPSGGLFGTNTQQRPVRNMGGMFGGCLLYTSPSPRDLSTSRMPSSA